jgi:hypothetical protein
VLTNTPIDVNSTEADGWTPISFALSKGHYEVHTRLIERGANIFVKDNDGERAIDDPVRGQPTTFLGPLVLNYAKDIKWESVKPLHLVSASYLSQSINIFETPFAPESAAQIHSDRLAFSILTNPGLLRLIGSFFIPANFITRDRTLDVTDEVRERIEAELAAAINNAE